MAQKAEEEARFRVIATNRRARHDFHILDRFEAGLVLTGTEIKSLRQHAVSLQHSFVQPRGDELWLVQATIAPYEKGNRENHEPDRPRKLLLHRREIDRILAQLKEKGLTLIPLRLYLKDGWAKVEIGLARGKKLFDKRADLARRDSERQIQRALREKYGR